MRLELFKLLDETVQMLSDNKALYTNVEQLTRNAVEKILVESKLEYLGIHSRIKSKESLREKIIRNRYYMQYNHKEEILNALPDIIGLRIECRFLKDEALIFENIKKYFISTNSFCQFMLDENLFLDLKTIQPQKQKNGLNIYRIDGYYLINNIKVNFELQIKSLVNAFWSNIEHKLIYKNKHYLDVDRFMSDLLVSINQSLSVLDSQLALVHDQIQNLSRKDIEFNEKNIENLITKAINDLFSSKMQENLGFSLSIKYTSKLLASYLFNKDILYATNGEDRIANLLKVLRKITNKNISFEDEIVLESQFNPDNVFQAIFGNFLLAEMNKDYDWYIFFKMLFAIELGNDITNFVRFLEIMQQLLIDEYWFKTSFVQLESHDKQIVQNELLRIFSQSLIHINSVQIVSSITIKEMNQVFKHFVTVIEMECETLEDFNCNKEMYQKDWNNIAKQILDNDQ